jgi:hypothetical protein
MALVVKPLNSNYKVSIEAEEEKVTFTFSQLDYRTKSLISSLTTSVAGGQYSIDATMQIFYNLKYGLKAVDGLLGADGEPYKLEFEDKNLSDNCVDELLATPVSNNLQYTARELSRSVLPNEIVHPLTLKKLEGVTVEANKDGVKKK